MRSLSRTAAGLLCFLAALTFVAAPATAVEPPEVRVAQTLNAAWNVGDLPGVLAAFSDDAQIRQSRAQVEFYGPNVEVDDVYGTGLSFFGESPPTDGDQLVWARGQREIALWAGRFLAAGHQPVASGYRLIGQTVTWDYRVSPASGTRAYLPGFPASVGTATAQIADGKIAALTLESAPDTAALRVRALEDAAMLAAARDDAQAALDASGLLRRLPPTQERTTSSTAPGLVALAGLAATACLAARARAPIPT